MVKHFIALLLEQLNGYHINNMQAIEQNNKMFTSSLLGTGEKVCAIAHKNQKTIAGAGVTDHLPSFFC